MSAHAQDFPTFLEDCQILLISLGTQVKYPENDYLLSTLRTAQKSLERVVEVGLGRHVRNREDRSVLGEISLNNEFGRSQSSQIPVIDGDSAASRDKRKRRKRRDRGDVEELTVQLQQAISVDNKMRETALLLRVNKSFRIIIRSFHQYECREDEQGKLLRTFWVSVDEACEVFVAVDKDLSELRDDRGGRQSFRGTLFFENLPSAYFKFYLFTELTRASRNAPSPDVSGHLRKLETHLRSAAAKGKLVGRVNQQIDEWRKENGVKEGQFPSYIPSAKNTS